jgi:hypothetical protein
LLHLHVTPHGIGRFADSLLCDEFPGHCREHVVILFERVQPRGDRLFVSELRRDAGNPISTWTWSKVVEEISDRSGVRSATLAREIDPIEIA